MPDNSALPSPTLDDMRRCGADELLAEPTPARTYHEMESRLVAGFAPAQSAGDMGKANALRLLGGICSMTLQPDERAAPFSASFISNTRRSMLPDDLTAADIDMLASFTPELQHPLLRARLADLVWLRERRRGIVFAQIAIDGYRHPILDKDDWDSDALKCRQRAVQLALSIGNGGGTLAKEIGEELLGAFRAALDCKDSFRALRYLRPVYSEGLAKEEAGSVASELEQLARSLLQRGKPFESLQLADIAQQWYARARDDQQRAAAQVLVAECWVAQAEADGSGISREHFYTKAIAAYQSVPAVHRARHNVNPAIEQLRSRLPAAGLDMLAMMKTASHSFDISELVAQAVQKVQGLPPIEAFLAFCEIAPWPSLATLREEGSIPLSGIAAMFSAVHLDEDGRVIAHEEGVSDADSRERRLAAEMVKACARRADLSARAVIDPALDAMRVQFHLSLHDFLQFTRLSALVPSERAEMVAKGLYAGYCRDFIQAIHILVPQFEHMVRVVLKDAGAVTTSRQDGIEMELGLSKLVDLPEMNVRFGEALTFTIRSLMCKPIGPNLRNKVAHGLAGAELCYSGYGVYAWWLILSLVIQGYHMMLRADQARSTEDEDGRAT